MRCAGSPKKRQLTRGRRRRSRGAQPRLQAANGPGVTCSRARQRHAEDVDRMRAAAQLQGRQGGRADVQPVRIERVLEGAREQHFAGAGPLAQARGDVDRVADEGVAHVRGRADVAGDHVALVDADAESGLDLVALLPGARQRAEARRASRARPAPRAAALSGCSSGTPKPSIRQSPAMWNTVPSCRKVISVRSEKYSLSSGTTSMRVELLGDAGEAAQVGEQHDGVGAHIGRSTSSVSRSCASSRILSATRGDT